MSNDILNESKLALELNAQDGIIYNLLKSSYKDNSFSTPLATKVQNLITSQDVAQSLKITSKTTQANLLGLNEANPDALTYNDWLEIKEVLKEKLVNLQNDTQTKALLTEIQNQPSDMQQLELRATLKKTMEDYYSNLLHKEQLLQEMSSLRTGAVPKVCDNKIMDAGLKKKINEQKMVILESRSRINVFGENSIAQDAYKNMIEDIIKQQDDCKRNIEDAKQMLGRYKAVNCKEYEHIFKQYVEYKNSYEKISELYNKVKN